MDKYKLVAPDLDRLLRYFRDGHLNPSTPSPELAAAMDPLFHALSGLAPLKSNEEAKAIWLRIPRGCIEDYDSFDGLAEYGEVKNREEFEALWLEDYPEEYKWYELVTVESRGRDGTVCFRAVALDHKTVISAALDRSEPAGNMFTEEAAITLCHLLTEAAAEPLRKLSEGTYNDEVSRQLPYEFRTGVIRRSAVWAIDPEWKAHSMDGLSEERISTLRERLSGGTNDVRRIGRIRRFTANDFFRACALGYKALGYDCDKKTPAALYLRYADGRDEGLTGKGHGLNEGPGIEYDDPDAWNNWYFDRQRGGGHPWEIIRGGNSTPMALFVCDDRHELDWQLRCGKISEETHREQMAGAGYYFRVCGKHRPLETVTFWLTLSDAGLPVIMDNAEEILARLEGTDYIGIVPHHVTPKYCEGMFPDRYGRVIDFMHVYDEDLEQMASAIEWLPEEPARLTGQAE